MSEGFDANVDCVTEKPIPLRVILDAALEQRFDGLSDSVSGWSYYAALAILKDLSWRNVIGPALKGLDRETRLALTRRLSDIIEARLAVEERVLGVDVQADEYGKVIIAIGDDGFVIQPRQQDVDRLEGALEGLVSESEATEAVGGLRILDLDETVDRISHLERERDEAVARADVADYTRDALVARCKDLEAQLAVEGRVDTGSIKACLCGRSA